MTTQQYLANKGVSMEQAQTFIMENLDNVENIFNVCKQFGVNNDMLADIVQTSFPGVTGEIVSSFFTNNGFDGNVLGFNSNSSTPATTGTLDVSNIFSYGQVQLWQNTSLDAINQMPILQESGFVKDYAYASNDTWDSIKDLGYTDNYTMQANGSEMAYLNDYSSTAVGIDINNGGEQLQAVGVSTIAGPYDLIIAL